MIKGIREEWTQVDLVSQVGSSVAGLLIAVVDLMDRGNRIVFDAAGSYIEDRQTGAQTKIYRRGKKLEVDDWVPKKKSAVSGSTAGAIKSSSAGEVRVQIRRYTSTRWKSTR